VDGEKYVTVHVTKETETIKTEEKLLEKKKEEPWDNEVS